jgi:hypothetical protein
MLHIRPRHLPHHQNKGKPDHGKGEMPPLPIFDGAELNQHYFDIAGSGAMDFTYS